jgi:hypothetical protein
MRAMVDRSGVILLRRTDHSGLLTLAFGPRRILEEAISGCARKARDGSGWVVPGVPEAETDEAAFEAVQAFTPRLQRAVDRCAAEAVRAAA